jgi:hypothetical protein
MEGDLLSGPETHRPTQTRLATDTLAGPVAGHHALKNGLDEADCKAIHPRSRGEHDARIGRDCVLGGSSPLARGTLHLLTRPLNKLF